MMAGMAAQAVVPASRVLVIFCIFIYSLGDHIQLGMRNTLSLQYAKEGRGGEALGLQHAVYQIGTLAGYLVIIGVFFFRESSTGLFRSVFAASAGVIALGFLATLHMTGSSVPDETKRRFYFRKKYTKYYMLEVFYGARKQVFFTFGPYVLVLFYGASAMVISILFAVSSVCCFFASPLVGKIIDRFGYKIVMITDTLVLVIVCFFYGFAHHIFPMHTAFLVCCVNYVLDSIISLASMASNVYVQDLSDSADEVRATISTGVSVNHLITFGIMNLKAKINRLDTLVTPQVCANLTTCRCRTNHTTTYIRQVAPVFSVRTTLPYHLRCHDIRPHIRVDCNHICRASARIFGKDASLSEIDTPDTSHIDWFDSISRGIYSFQVLSRTLRIIDNLTSICGRVAHLSNIFTTRRTIQLYDTLIAHLIPLVFNSFQIHFAIVVHRHIQ